MIQAQIRSLSDTCLEVKGLTQWDRGQKLEITGLDLPSAVEIHFATQDGEEAKVMVGKTVDGVTRVAYQRLYLSFRLRVRRNHFHDSHAGAAQAKTE